MRGVSFRLFSSIVLIYALLNAIYYARGSDWLKIWIGLLVFVALPFFVMSWIAMGKALRNYENPSPLIWTIGILFVMPQAILGLLSVILGLALTGWVLYYMATGPELDLKGSITAIFTGLAFILFGASWVYRAFTRDKKEPEVQDQTGSDSAPEE